ncbi:MAG: gas vesicle protein GvpO [Syntrophales bacterium]|nr:gas vesicle protein GvpO [Syntrophales bacterium]
MALKMAEVIKKARGELNDLTGLEISSTVSAGKEDDGWLIIMEVIEKHSIPDGMDILAKYEVRLDTDGNMLDFKRTGLRKRIDPEDAEG